MEETKPDVILSYEKELELWLEETGYRIPEDLGFALIDYSQDYGDISGVDQQVEEIGKAAVNTLVAHVEQNVMGIPACPTFVRLGGVWHDGGTLLKVST